MIERIIKYSGYDFSDDLILVYYDVEFLENFGSFTMGDKVHSMGVDYNNGTMEAYNEEGTEVIKSCKIELSPVK